MRLALSRAGLHVACLAIAATFVLGSCGDDGEPESSGAISIGLAAEPDALDPALSFSPEVWESLWVVYTPLLTYEHAEGEDGAELMPGLAEDLPEISEDGRRYELRLREGLEYSDGTRVRASDFEHAIKRVFSLESPGTPFFTGIEGAKEFIERGRGDIPGIEADDGTREISIELTAPDATFANSLATTFAGLVPGDTPSRDMTSEPPPGVGPYTFVRPDEGFEFALERSDGFDVPDIPTGELDRIDAEIVRDAGRGTEDVITGELDYIVNPPAPDQLEEVRSRYSDRYREFTTASTYFFFMRPDAPPFDRQEVREAVNLAIDQSEIVRLFGGLLNPTCNLIPPNVPGHEPLDPCPYGDPQGEPDLDAARELVDSVGADGAEVTVWGNSEPEPRRVTDYLVDVLNRIGLDAEPRIIGPAVYFETVGAERTDAQIGFANYLLDFPHPANVMQVVDGDILQDRATANVGRVEDLEISRRIDELLREPDLSEVTDEWAEVDAHAIEDAWVAPFGHRELTTFVSERMGVECAVVHPVYGHDYTSFCLR
jgi:peptide/nickel transport system substrate-binding protein